VDDQPLTLDPCFGKLGRDISRFANHTKKLVHASQRHRQALLKASEWTEGTAPLDHAPESPAAAMRSIDKFARIHRENRHTLFGAYFAHHHLRQQAEISQALLRASFDTSPGARIRTCYDVLGRAVTDRRAWIAALLECSIGAAVPELRSDHWVAFNVGALSDHEDVDLAVVVSSVEARKLFAKGFAALSKTFLRFASKIQLFLAEQLSNPRAGGLIEEYEEIVKDPQCSVVVVMQLLGGTYLCGSKALGRRLHERVAERFYAESGDALAHEGFLRSVMAELRHYHNLDRVSDVLAPKREIYIPTKLVTAAMRVIHGVREPRASVALLDLAKRDTGRRHTYESLADAFVQNEVLRALLFLYVVKQDSIDLYDSAILGHCRRVAVLLGLGRSARRSPEARLLAYYKDLRARAMGRVFELSFDINAHLRNVSTFRQIIERGRALKGTDANIAIRLLHAVKRYERGVFWDEILELLSGTNDLVDRFIADLDALSEDHRASVAREFVRLMCTDAKSLIEFLIFLSAYDREHDIPFAPHAMLFWEAMMAVLKSDTVQLESFIARVDDETEAEALHRLANSFAPTELARLANFLEQSDKTTRGDRVVRSLRSMIILCHHHANRTGRLVSRVLGRIPDFIHRVGDDNRLRGLARDLMTQAAREPVPREQIELLGDAFDVQILSGSLFAILEGAPGERDAAYVEAFDRYVRELFKACFRGVQGHTPIFEKLRPGSGIALFATGGFGRGEGFGADWDYVAVVRDDDGGTRKFFSKVVQRLTAAISRRGLIPHNRFTDKFNSYVVSVNELRDHLRARTEETFIDEAEILETRFMFGDPSVRQQFAKDISTIVIDENRYAFIKDILHELRVRRDTPPMGLDIKLSPGGLREIHLLWLAVRAFAHLPGAFSAEHFAEATRVLPRHRADFRFLLIANAELRRIRDLYRLVIGQDAPMDAAALVEIANDLRPLQEAGAHDDFDREIRMLMKTSELRIDRIAERVNELLEDQG